MPILMKAFLPVFLSFSYFLRAIGPRNLGRLGDGLGSLFLRLGFRERIVRENLALAYGKEKSPAEIDALVPKIYRCIGRTFLEIARNFALTREEIRDGLIVSDEDRARLAEYRLKGKGGVFISGHISNWELLAMGIPNHGFPTTIVVKKMNDGLSQLLIERQRARTGLGVIYSGGTIEKMKKVLAEGTFIGFMVDQNTTGTKGIRANFFGVPASSIRGLAGLHRDTGTPIVPICSYREADGRHRMVLLPELKYLTAPELPEGSEERALREEWLNTQQYQSAIESMVRRHPEQWMWIHRRWKAKRDPLDPATAHLENCLEAKPPGARAKSESKFESRPHGAV